MLDWILPPIAFTYAFNEVQPAQVVDKLIETAVSVLIPGRGAGESRWWMRGIRNLEQRAQRSQRELDIRSNLRQWDREFPYFHHELIIRYAAGILASNAAVIACSLLRDGLFGKTGGKGNHPRR